MRLALAALLVLASCHSGLAVKLTFADDADEERLVEAADLLGLDVHFVDRKRGAVEVTMMKMCDPDRDGVAIDTHGCRRRIVTSDRAPSIAHELGHALGLGHVDDEANVMSRVAGEELTDEQRDRLSAEVANLGAWCR